MYNHHTNENIEEEILPVQKMSEEDKNPYAPIKNVQIDEPTSYPPPNQYTDYPNSNNARNYNMQRQMQIRNSNNFQNYRNTNAPIGGRKKLHWKKTSGGHNNVRYEVNDEYLHSHPTRISKSRESMTWLRWGLFFLLGISILFLILVALLLFFSTTTAVIWISVIAILGLIILISVIICLRWNIFGLGSLFIEDVIFTNTLWITFVIFSVVFVSVLLVLVYKQASESFWTLFFALPLTVIIILIILFVVWLALIILLIYSLVTHTIGRNYTLQILKERSKPQKQESES